VQFFAPPAIFGGHAMTTIYTARATSVAGRGGHVETEDKALSFNLVPPGGDKKGTNPEQLFACGYSACFGGATMAVAKKLGIDPGEVKIEAEVSLNKEGEGFSISASLSATLPNVDADTAVKIVKDAHQVCPYSKATRNNVDVKLTANGQKIQG
jgi:osmotically inducible protein OsmC